MDYLNQAISANKQDIDIFGSNNPTGRQPYVRQAQPMKQYSKPVASNAVGVFTKVGITDTPTVQMSEGG